MSQMLEYPLKGWVKGLQTQGRDWETPPDALRTCVNWDITDTGQLVRRPGRTLLYSGAIQPDSLYGHGDRLYFVESGVLKVYTNAGIRTLATVGAGAMRYAEAAGVLYYTNNRVTGRIMDEAATHWGLSVPSQQPTLTAQGGGTLYAGTYQVALTWDSLLPNGAEEESGAALAGEITLADGGGISLTQFPVPDQATAVNVYVSHANGSVLFFYNSYLSGISQVSISSDPTGPELESQFHRPPPPGQCLCAHRARLLVAQDTAVYLTEPFYPSLVDYRESVLVYEAPVTLLYPVTDGVYVGTEAALWFLSGLDSNELTQRKVADYGITLGTGVGLPQTAYGGMCWSERGILSLGDSGQIKPVFEGRIALDGSSYVRGTAGYREARPDGQRSVVFILRPVAPASPSLIHARLATMETTGLAAQVYTVLRALPGSTETVGLAAQVLTS